MSSAYAQAREALGLASTGMRGFRSRRVTTGPLERIRAHTAPACSSEPGSNQSTPCARGVRRAPWQHPRHVEGRADDAHALSGHDGQPSRGFRPDSARPLPCGGGLRVRGAQRLFDDAHEVSLVFGSYSGLETIVVYLRDMSSI